MIKQAINNVVEKRNLSKELAYHAIEIIMTGTATDIETSSLLTALSVKGETADEIEGAAAAMRDQALAVVTDMDTLDIVGTGGDKSYSFNISSTSALVLAAGGVPVSKHGNRSASSKSGAADVLEYLGVNVHQTPEQATLLLKKHNICFLFAQKYHTAMGEVGKVRKELGIRTVFNILGPITNPAKPKYQILGVYDERLLEPMAEVISNLGVQRGMVVYGQDGMDEISISDKTSVCEFNGNNKSMYEINPRDFGFPKYHKSDIVGGNPQENARITRDILNGTLQGAKRDIVLLNAGAGFYIYGLCDSINEGIQLAKEIIDSGRAMQTLEAYITDSHNLIERIN